MTIYIIEDYSKGYGEDTFITSDFNEILLYINNELDYTLPSQDKIDIEIVGYYIDPEIAEKYNKNTDNIYREYLLDFNTDVGQLINYHRKITIKA